MGFTGQATEKQKEVKARKKQRIEDLGNLALKISTKNLEGNSMSMHGETPIYLVKRNSGSLTGWKRVVAAVIFNQTGHELCLRQDWEEEKNGMMDFPNYKTLFILKKGEEESSQ